MRLNLKESLYDFAIAKSKALGITLTEFIAMLVEKYRDEMLKYGTPEIEYLKERQAARANAPAKFRYNQSVFFIHRDYGVLNALVVGKEQIFTEVRFDYQLEYVFCLQLKYEVKGETDVFATREDAEKAMAGRRGK